MKRLIALAVGALGALGSTTSASAAPAWCKDAHFDRDDDLLKKLSDKDPIVVMTTFAHVACAPTPEVDAHKAELEQNRAAWGKRLGMVEADWGDVVAYIAGNYGSTHTEVTNIQYSTKEFAQFTPLDQYKAIAGDLPRYYTDVFDPHLSEVGRYAFIDDCIKHHTLDTYPVARWAECQGDIEKFDLAKFSQELHGDTAHGGDVRMWLRFQAFDINARLKEHASSVQEAWKKDPAYKKMFDVAAKARTEWAAGTGTNTKLLELVTQLDSAIVSGSRKQFDGCEDRTEQALHAEAAKMPAAQFKGKDIGPVLVQNPSVSLAAMAYIMCRDAKREDLDTFLASNLEATVGSRGPRSAVLSRLFGEGFVLDDVHEKIDWPGDRKDPPWGGRNIGGVGAPNAVVASTKVEGDAVIVTREAVMVARDYCVKSHKTNRVVTVNTNGDVGYESVCDKSETSMDNDAGQPFKLDKKYAPLLKKGMKLSTIGKDVLAIWPNKTATTPSWLLGAVLK